MVAHSTTPQDDSELFQQHPIIDDAGEQFANLPVATTQVYVVVRRFQAPSDADAAVQRFEFQLQNGIEHLGETDHRSITHEDRSGFLRFTVEQYDVAYGGNNPSRVVTWMGVRDRYLIQVEGVQRYQDFKGTLRQPTVDPTPAMSDLLADVVSRLHTENIP